MLLLKTINEEDVGFGTAFLVSFVTAIGATVLAIGLVSLMGMAGIVVAALLAAAILGVAVSALFGMEIKRAFLVAGIFVVAHVAVSAGVNMMLSS
jgi:hypothetical protein